MKLLAAEVAQARVTRAWVYAHAEELGAIRLGSGPKPRLRFAPDLLGERLASRSASEGSRAAEEPTTAGPRGGSRRSRLGNGGDLLPTRSSERPHERAQSNKEKQ
jgi:hypothetical protein